MIWLLGPTSSGKTTIALLLLEKFRKSGLLVLHYDGDEIRDFFGPSLSFEASDRMRVVSTLTHLANKATEAGTNVIVSALTANEDARDYINRNVKNLLVCYVKCSIDTCVKRDPKGLYRRAKQGEINTLIGFNSKSVPPENPDIIVDTDFSSASSAADKLFIYLIKNNDFVT